MTLRVKFGLALVLIFFASISLLFFYLPQHWLKQVSDFGPVTVEGQLVHAETYLGRPTTNEAEAFLLVCIPGEGNFLFNFLGENYRDVTKHEFVRLYWGAVTLKPMAVGPWVQPLPFLAVNEFRVRSSNGHTIIVKL